MKLLVTGATGFIGSQITPVLSQGRMATRVLALTEHPWEEANAERLEELGIELHHGSVTDPVAVDRAVQGMDTVLHLAAAQGDMSLPDEHFRHVNVEGTRMLLDACVRHGVRRFVHGSTVGVYGNPATQVSHDTPPAPTNIYGITKLEGEETVRNWEGGPERVILRLPETYGPGDRRLLKLFGPVKRGRFPMIGDGKNLHQPIYVQDLVPLFQLALDSPAAVDELFVVGGPRAITTTEMVDAVAEAVAGSRPRIRIPMAPVAALAVVMERTLRPLRIDPPLHTRRLDFYRKSFSIDAGKARDVLGYVPATDFREGAKATALWYEDRGLI